MAITRIFNCSLMTTSKTIKKRLVLDNDFSIEMTSELENFLKGVFERIRDK